MDGPGFGLELRRFRRHRGLSLRAMQELVRYDFTYLGQVERGEKPGSLALAETCDDALEAEGLLVALFQNESSHEFGDGEANDAHGPGLRSGAAPLLLPQQKALVNADFRGDSIPEAAGRDLSRMATLRVLYHGTYSVGQLAHWVEIYLFHNKQRLTSDVAKRPRLLRERADAAMLAGRLALFDRWRPIEARGYLTTACEAAVAAGDPALAAGAFGHLAFIPARERLSGVSAVYLNAARRYADRSGVPSLASWIAAVEAEVRVSGEPGEALRALDRAAGTLARPPGEPKPDWFDFYSAGRLDGFRGQVLVAAGRGGEGRQALGRALAALEPDAVKQRSVLLADLAASHLCAPDPDLERVAADATHAATELARTGYRAGADRLVRLRRQLEPWCDARAVRDLDEVLDEVLPVRGSAAGAPVLARGSRA